MGQRNPCPAVVRVSARDTGGHFRFEGRSGERSCETVCLFLPIEVRSLPGPSAAADEGPAPSVWFWGVETEAARPESDREMDCWPFVPRGGAFAFVY